MGQLGEALGTRAALERPLTRVRPQMDLKVGQLTERLIADVALVMHFSVLFAQRIRQRTMASSGSVSGE